MFTTVFLISFVFYIIIRKYSNDIPKRKVVLYTVYLIASMYITRYLVANDTFTDLPKSKFYELSSNSYHPSSSI